MGGAILTAGLLGGCGGGSPAPLISENAGEVLAQADTSIGSSVLIGESHFGGEKSNLGIVATYWGRLVSVADSTDGGTTSDGVKLRDFVISNSIRDLSVFQPSIGGSMVFQMTRNVITDATTLLIPAALGTVRFNEALVFLESNLTPVSDHGLGTNETAPFSMVPRNSAIVMRFDDLLEPHYTNGEWKDLAGGGVVNPTTGQLNQELLKVRVNYPPVDTFTSRTIVDPNHGDLFDADNNGIAEFYSTRLIISTTVSTIQSQVSNPPLAINTIGLPPSTGLSSSNLVLRVPTALNPSVGQTQVLRNLSGHPVSFSSNGSTSTSSGTLDVVRALRSGGTETSDANNGFLLDEDAPALLGDLAIFVSGTPTQPDPVNEPQRYRIPTMAFSVVGCAPGIPTGESSSLKIGDVIVLNNVSSVVVFAGNGGSVINNVLVDVLAPVGGVLLAGTGRLQTPYVTNDVADCFVTFSPTAITAPSTGIATNAQVIIRFSEPMDPATIRPFDSMTIKRVLGEADPYEYVIGTIAPSADLRSFSFSHTQNPFNHLQGAAEQYFLAISGGAAGPRDLAGNELANPLADEVSFTINPAAPSSVNGGFVMRFGSANEFYGDNFGELRDFQILYDPINERIKPRPVSRFDVAADRNHPLPAVMTQFTPGVQTPLSKLGSKLQTIWRYVDMGFSISDESNFNMDVEGISWAPVGGSVVTDTYDEFMMILSHSRFLPDEILDPGSGFPIYPNSGLKGNSYANNFADAIKDPGTLVHEKPKGYTVNPANLYVASSGTSMLPFPMNQTDQGVSPEEFHYYTWRDTALTALGGPSGFGALLEQEDLILNGATGTTAKTYTRDNVATVGLPLLMEFRCYAADEASGLNSFDISLAANSSPTPNFRAFSTGGYDASGTPQPLDPDTDSSAHGGYNPTSNPPGAPTPGVDNSFYIGELALVTRVSRAHTIWFDTNFTRSTFLQPIIEPALQPSGASVVLAYRGAVNITGDNNASNIGTDSAALGAYGDPVVGANGVGSPNLFGSGEWVNDITQLNNSKLLQVRISFLSNPVTGQTASLDSLAFAYFDADAN
ncbi:MAG: hypothetical protein ACI8X5_000324 [Planctomycetota bacterium]|jgi:hypothetical protein